VDAVVVGAGTVALDDPRLTVREVEGANPVRVVHDPDDRLGRDRRVFSDGGAATIVVRRVGAAPADLVSEAPHGGSGAAAEGTAPRANLEVIALASAESEGYDPAAVLGALRARGLRRVLVEGGGVTVSRFLQAGLLDRLHVTVAPLLIGSGRPALTLPPIESLAEALRPRCRHVHLGEDLLFDLDLR
jgi:riboflavin-specific deaminase-like protein